MSVVVPTYNRSRFLGLAVESVLAQTEQSFEILIIDDGSEDDGQERVAASYHDPRIRYYRMPQRRGPAAARNAGVRCARASYIAFLDDDDEWIPQKLARQLGVFDLAPPEVGGICTARFTVDRSAGTVIETRLRAERCQLPMYRNYITTSSLLVRRQCFDAVGEFDEELEASSDYEMWLRISLVYRFVYLDEPLVRYAVHANQISRDYERKARSTARILEKHASFFESDRRAFSRAHVGLGVLHCYSGNIAQGRRAFWRAVRLDPRSRKAYSNLALSLLGGKPFRAVSALRRRLATSSSVFSTLGRPRSAAREPGAAVLSRAAIVADYESPGDDT